MEHLADRKGHPWKDTIRQLEEERYYEEMTNRQRGGPLQPTPRSSHAPVPRVPGQSARPPLTTPRVDYTNYNHLSGNGGSSGGRSRRRRPRVGIFRAASPTTSYSGASASAAAESNLDSVELALQDTSKTSSSTVSTDSRSPGRNSSSQDTSHDETCSSTEEAELIQHLPYQESTPPTKPPRSTTSSTPPLQRPSYYPTAYSPNPTNPFADSPVFYHTTTNNNNNIATATAAAANPFDIEDEEETSNGKLYYSDSSQQDAHDVGTQRKSGTATGKNNTSEGHHHHHHHQHQAIHTTNTSATTTSQTSGASEDPRFQEKMGLHILCAEATSQHDIAWRNALYLLGMQPPLSHVIDRKGRTALHVACEGCLPDDKNDNNNNIPHQRPTPPPCFMIRALLVANVKAARQVDRHGRLPIHCLAASSGDVDSLQILVEAYPGSITVRDAAGWTPLALFLQNPMVLVTLAQTQILLGMTLPHHHEEQDRQKNRIRLRRGDHMQLKVEHLDQMLKQTNPVYDPLKRYKIPEDVLNSYPEDVRVCLKRLGQWDRKQQRLQQQQAEGETSKDTEFCSEDQLETNPAAMTLPANRQLPLHMIVYRGLLDANLQKSRTQRQDRSSQHRKKKNSPQFHQQTLILLVRLLIAAFPDGLITRDSNGHTPLLLAMLTASAETLPSQELLELLLGKRTAGFESLPSWAQDVPFPSQHVYTPPSHNRLSASAERYSNPAMVATLDTCQLPLHIAVEEWGQHTSLIVAVFESYPGAIHVQDARGRMPLHVLLQNYRRVAPHPHIVALLLSDRVAQTTSDEGYLPFDLLVESASCLPFEPSTEPITSQGKLGNPDPYTAFGQFFHASIVASSAMARANRLNSSGTDMIASGPSSLQLRAEARDFLWRLRSLPPWLRRQACSVPFVQEMIVQEMASPSKCAFIFMYGIFLGLLLMSFRRQLEIYMVRPVSPDMFPANMTFFDGTFTVDGSSTIRYDPWNTLAVYGLSAGLFCFQATFWGCTWLLGEFRHLCLFNIWRWVDLLAIALAITTTVMIHEGYFDEHILVIGTAATGMLWLNVVGYLSNWWYGMAFFSEAILKITRVLMWPIVVGAVFLIGFAEMFYTLGQKDCNGSSGGDMTVCSLREAYQLLYSLILGKPIVDIGGEPIRLGMALLVGLFTALIFLLFLSFLVVVVVVASKCDAESVSLDAYWEPKLAFVLFSQDARARGSNQKKANLARPSSLDRFVSRLEELWDIAISLVSGRAQERYWYARSSSPWKNCCLGVISALLIPVWFVAGIVSLGFLWPPQVRCFLLKPRGGLYNSTKVKPNEAREYYTSQVSGVRNEVMNLKDMSYEQSNEMYHEIQELKALLIAATKEE